MYECTMCAKKINPEEEEPVFKLPDDSIGDLVDRLPYCHNCYVIESQESPHVLWEEDSKAVEK